MSASVGFGVCTSSAAADGGQTSDHAGIIPTATTLYLMDLPLLRNADDEPGVYAAVTGLPGWTGASIWRAADGVTPRQFMGLVRSVLKELG